MSASESAAAAAATAAAAPANIRVLVRVRPLSDRESRSSPSSILEIDDGGMGSSIDFGVGDERRATASAPISGGRGKVVIVDQGGGSGGYGSGYDSGANGPSAQQRSFTYDAVFGPQSRQAQIFDSVEGIIDAVCAGYNGTIVAYGQTGSGKTYTVFGEEGREGGDDAGLVQRALKSIFEKIARPTSDAGGGGGITRTTTKASFLEIYNERVYDLLSPNDGNATEDDRGLSVREDSAKGVYVEGLFEWEVNDTSEAMDALRRGMANRSVAATNMNRVSSRSHAVFVLTVRSELVSEDGGVSKVRMSKFTLVDLAGSERQKTTAADGDRLKEASMINTSLLCLGQVINSLVDREKGKSSKHVPFRDSKLTFLLRDSFGGNSKTCLVATVTPSASSLSETISTLTFAQRAKLITNTAVLNENTCVSVTALQAEIVRLRAELDLANGLAPLADGGDRRPAFDQELLPSESIDVKKPASDVTVNALMHQNSKLSSKVKVLGEVCNHREVQVNLLKRKLQQETLIRKCKDRRITYLSSKGKTLEVEGDNEIAALREEVAVLREQLEAVPSESVDWMLKYKETKAKVDELESSATDAFGSDEKFELEASLVSLLNERDSLRQKLQNMSDERNIEIDNIIKDVTTLENSNVMLQSRLDEKELVMNENLEKIQTNEAHIKALQGEMKVTVACLESTQSVLAAEKLKTAELQEVVDGMKIQVDNANAACLEHQDKMTAAKEESARMAERHNESMTELNTKLGKLHDDLASAMSDNESLMSKLKQTSDDLQCTKIQLENLEQVKDDALRQLELTKEKSIADLESFKLQEDTLRAELKKVEEILESLVVEKSKVAANLEDVVTNNTLLLVEVEALTSQRDALQRSVASLDKLHDRVAMLEDDVVFFTIETERLEERLQSNEADCDRTIRLQEHLRYAQVAAHIDELALCDESIDHLSREKSIVQNELATVSRQLLQVAEASEEKIALLQDKTASLETKTKKAEETVEFLRNHEAQIAQRLEQVTDEMEIVKMEREELEVSLNARITELQTEKDAAVGGKESLADQLKEASNDAFAKECHLNALVQERDQALKQLEAQRQEYNADIATMTASLKDAEDTNDRLLAEKAETADNLAKTAIQSKSLSEEVDALKSERSNLQERIASLHRLRDYVDALEDEMDFVTISKSQVDAQLKFAEADLDRTGRLLNLRDNDLALGHEVIVTLSAEKAVLQRNVTDISKQLAAIDTELGLTKTVKSDIESERDVLKSRVETLKATIESLVEERASAEALKAKIEALEEDNSSLEALKAKIVALEEENASLDALKARIKALEEENLALREQPNVNPPSSSSSSDDTSSLWETSPIKSVDKALQETAFGADDTFDESMFLPNVDGETDTPQTGDSNSPSKTPFKEKRALFSPEKSTKKAQTPAKRLTRAMRNKMRTPLGKSAIQNTPLSTMSTRKASRASMRKKHTNMVKSDF